MPFLSIIIPVYNAEKYLDDCFRSIRKQSFTDYEVIIIDDGSKDASPGICDKVSAEDVRFKTFHVPNGGPSRARNTGFLKATGQYIYCIDNDDYIDGEDLFQKIHDSLAEHPVDVLQTGATYIKDGEIVPRKILSLSVVGSDDISSPAKTIYNLIVHGNYETSCWTKVISRQFLLDNELFFDESLTVEDLDWNMRFLPLIKKYNLLPRSDYIHVYRAGSVSTTSGKKLLKNCNDQVVTIRKWQSFWEQYQKNVKIKKAALGYLCYQFCITLALSMNLETNDRQEIKKSLNALKHILRYGIGKRERMAYFIFLFSGLRGVNLVSNIYYKFLRT